MTLIDYRALHQSALRERDTWKQRAEQAETERDRLQHLVECADTPLMRDVLERLRAAEAVVAAQREARDWLIRQLDGCIEDAEAVALACELATARALHRNLIDARAALDAEGVSEPGRVDQIATGKTTGAPASPGSLTSPVDACDEPIMGVQRPQGGKGTVPCGLPRGHSGRHEPRTLTPTNALAPLTSPVDRDVCECGHGKDAHPYVGRIASWPTRCMYCDCQMFVPVLTSPVDTIRRIRDNARSWHGPPCDCDNAHHGHEKALEVIAQWCDDWLRLTSPVDTAPGVDTPIPEKCDPHFKWPFTFGRAHPVGPAPKHPDPWVGPRPGPKP